MVKQVWTLSEEVSQRSQLACSAAHACERVSSTTVQLGSLNKNFGSTRICAACPNEVPGKAMAAAQAMRIGKQAGASKAHNRATRENLDTMLTPLNASRIGAARKSRRTSLHESARRGRAACT